MDFLNNADHIEILRRISEREKDEGAALASTNSETLNKLGVPLSSMPQKCKNLLQLAADYQKAMELRIFDPIAFSLQHTDFALAEMEDEYEILKLRQKNEELDAEIEANKEKIEDLRNELEGARKALANENPSPETVLDEIRVVKQKITSYEQSYEKTKTKLSSLRVPSELYPASLQALFAQLETLRLEEAELRGKAEHISLARSAKRTLMQLKASKA